MLFQLPNGKTIEISIEDYLDMTDADVEKLMKANIGKNITSPWKKSAIRKDEESRRFINEIDYEYEDESEITPSNNISPIEDDADELSDDLLENTPDI